MSEVICRHVASPELIQEVGQFCFTPHSSGMADRWFLVIRLPDEGKPHNWPVLRVANIQQPPRDAHTWNWDGNVQRPSIAPSLWHLKVYHGTLSGGVLRPAGSPP
jgi:hypothetical protein